MSTAPPSLREDVLRANLALVEAGLVMGTFGNVSGVDRDAGVLVIKPSGVPYGELTPERMVAVSLETGRVLDRHLRPSSDTPTHLELYRAFPCGGIAHSHSRHATAFAQGRRAIACMGTTHADTFRGDVPVTRALRADEIAAAYERNTGLVIVETFRTMGLSPDDVPGVLVASHGPFTWGGDAAEAVEHARILEFVAELEHLRLAVAPDAPRPDGALMDRHHSRKHGPGATYGQPETGEP